MSRQAYERERYQEEVIRNLRKDLRACVEARSEQRNTVRELGVLVDKLTEKNIKLMDAKK